LMLAHVDTLVNIFSDIHARTTKPFFVCWVAAPEAAVARLRAMGIVVYGAGERAVEAASALVQYHASRRRAAEPTTELSPVYALPNGPFAGGVQPSVLATSWLRAAGIPMAEVALARDADQAVTLWRSAGAPVALKIESPDITHKTEVGGVLLNLDAEAAIRRAFRTLMDDASKAMPQARLDGVLVQTMAQGHLELVIGARRDPVFGMIVMVGLGGVLVEVLKDVAFRRAPFTVPEALRMLGELRMGAMLDGVRGRPPVDRQVLARMLSDLSYWVAAMHASLQELDLNPVLVGIEGPIAVDCVMVLRPYHAGKG